MLHRTLWTHHMASTRRRESMDGHAWRCCALSKALMMEAHFLHVMRLKRKDPILLRKTNQSCENTWKKLARIICCLINLFLSISHAWCRIEIPRCFIRNASELRWTIFGFHEVYWDDTSCLTCIKIYYIRMSTEKFRPTRMALKHSHARSL